MYELKCFCNPEILRFLKDNFYCKIYFIFKVAPAKLNKMNNNDNSKQKKKTKFAMYKVLQALKLFGINSNLT